MQGLTREEHSKAILESETELISGQLPSAGLINALSDNGIVGDADPALRNLSEWPAKLNIVKVALGRMLESKDPAQILRANKVLDVIIADAKAALRILPRDGEVGGDEPYKHEFPNSSHTMIGGYASPRVA